MAKFKFTLEPILSLRQNTEDLCKRALGTCLAEKSTLEKTYEQLGTTRLQIQEAMRPNQGEQLNIEQLKSYRIYDETLKGQQVKLQGQLNQIERVIEEKKKALQEAVKERKILENLKALQYESFIQQCKKEEQQLVDELVAYKYSQGEEA